MEKPSLIINAQNYLISNLKKLPKEVQDKKVKLSDEVLNILELYNLDETTKLAGILFYAENIDSKYISQEFNQDVARIIENLQLFYKNIVLENDEQVTQIKQLFLISCFDIRIMFICIANNLASLRNLSMFEQEKKEHLCQQALNVFAPISSRFGFIKIKRELEKKSFSYLYPEEFKKIKAVLDENKEKLKNFYKDFITKIEKIFKEEKIIYTFSLRTKEAWSAFLKARQKKIEYSELYDLIACRIILKSKMDCYKALGIIHGEYKPLRDRFKDYIITPKPNGYQSIHTSLSTSQGYHFEVQIRTEKMHEVAEMGLAAHFSYKEQKSISEKDLKSVQWIKDIALQLQNSHDSEHVIEIFKSEMAYDQIYTFTPKGEVIKLPKGATIIDFAYSIHTDIGRRCAGGLINNVLQPIRTKVHNGNKIKILTSAHVNPTSSWLDFAVTNKARYNIRHDIATQSVREAINLGEYIYTKKFKKFISKSSAVDKDEIQKSLLKKTNSNSMREVYADIGFGKIDINKIFQEKIVESEQHKSTPEKNLKKLKEKNETDNIASKVDIKDVQVRLAQCCLPSRKDDIVGIASKSGILSVHKANCSNVFYFIDKNKIIELNWYNKISLNQPTQIEFEFVEDSKIYRDIHLQINKNYVKIFSSNYHTENNTAYLVFSVYFNSQEDENFLLKSIIENNEVKCKINDKDYILN